MVPVTKQAMFSKVGFNRLKADFQDLSLTVREILCLIQVFTEEIVK